MKAVVYGGGNIGRGFLGQLLYNSGFETVFVDVNRELIDKLNETRSYPIKIVSNEKQEEVVIRNVRPTMLLTKSQRLTLSSLPRVSEYFPMLRPFCVRVSKNAPRALTSLSAKT